MGWTAGWGTKKVLVVHLLQNYDGERMRIKTLDWKVKREDGLSVLWRLVEVYDRRSNNMYNTILVYLIDKFREGWGYKDMEVSMGVGYFSCPENFLKLAPPLNDWDKEWRKEYYRRKDYVDRQEDDDWEVEKPKYRDSHCWR